MSEKFNRGFGTVLVILAISAFISGITAIAAKINSPPITIKPPGLLALENEENLALDQLLYDIRPQGSPLGEDTVPPIDPDAPSPGQTRFYNNLLDNILSSLHYFYRVPDDTPPAKFVFSWDAETGARVISEARLISMQYNVSYLLTLELYSRLHTKDVTADLEFARNRVDTIFSEDWRTVMEWPLDPYFELIELWTLTGEDKYVEYAERYAAGDGPNDRNTPFMKARDLAYRYQLGLPRMGSPVYFYYPALLADWGNRHDDPDLVGQSRGFFEGLRDLLYDANFNMLWKQGSVQQQGSSVTNVIRTFDTLEQLSAIQAITMYGEASGDPAAASLTRAVLRGIWGEGSPLLIPAPAQYSADTFYGLYTAYDHEREAERLIPTELTSVQILLYMANVLVNEQIRGGLRDDVDYLVGWLENYGPVYRSESNGYLTMYDEIWEVPENASVSASSMIDMARAIASDEWYRYRVAQAITAETPYD